MQIAAHPVMCDRFWPITDMILFGGPGSGRYGPPILPNRAKIAETD